MRRLLNRLGITVLLMFVSAASAGRAEKPLADMVLRGGTVLTLDETRPEVQAVAIRAGRIIWLGSDADATSQIGKKTRVVELRGRTVMPGFIESHGHFVGFGRSLMSVDLTGAEDYDEVVRRVAKAVRAARPGKWIVGRGWHQEKWTRPPSPHVEGYPTHGALSRVSPRNPVLLTHATGHMCLANQLAMQAAGITREARDPAGGTILRDAQGNPTGVFRENAMGPLYAAHERAERGKSREQRTAELRRAIELAGRECLRHGVTTFHDAGTSFSVVDLYRELASKHELPVRLYVMLNADNTQLAQRMDSYRCVGMGGDFLTIRAVKRIADGALGSHGAWMLEPYDDLPSTSGLQTLSLESLRETARLCVQHDFQLCVHAIGDRANREVLDLFEQVLRRVPDGRQRRWRIEHAQHLSVDDIPRFAHLGVIASMQGIHATSDGPFVVTRLGFHRARTGAYAWRSLLDAGAMIANGTDVPVEPIDPLACLQASVTRQLSGANRSSGSKQFSRGRKPQQPDLPHDRKNGVAFFPEQCMTRQEALRSYTLNGAYAAFEERLKGSITPGKLADLVILSANPLACPADRIAEIRVDMTLLNGKIVYQRSND